MSVFMTVTVHGCVQITRYFRELVVVILGCVLLNEVDLECVALDVVRRDQDIGVDVEWVSWDSVDFEWLGLDWLGDSVVTEGHI